MKRSLIRAVVALGGVFIGMSGVAQAATLSFGCISANDLSGVSCAVGSAQVSLEVTEIGNDQVLFWLSNTGSSASSIADIYFDDNENQRYVSTITGLIDADDGVGGSAEVDFSVGAAPQNLPGGNALPPVFSTTTGLSADSDAPVQHNGVNPGEYLGIVFSLSQNRTYTDLLSGLADGSFRVGLHIQGFSGGYSESFVNTPYVSSVPVPAAIWMFGSGLLGMTMVGRRRAV